MDFPVILEATIPNLAADLTGAPDDPRGLQNRTGKFLRIEEIRFPKANLTDRFSMSVQLRIGNEPVTNGFVPIAAMTWQFPNEIDVLLSQNVPARHLRFSRPVLLAPGQSLNVQARHTVGTQTQAVVVICRPVTASRPSFTPWFTFFRPPERTDGSGNFEDTSTESDLVNPFDDSMLVERLIGRLFFEDVSRNPIEIDAFFNPAGQLTLAFDSIRVRIEDHEATQIVRDATPFGVVFDFIRKSWVINAMLPAKGFYRVSVQSNLATQIVAETPAPVHPIIGMLGYREVK